MQPTDRQIVWLQNLIFKYFPYIDSKYPTEIFGDHLQYRKKDEEPLKLPKHLKYPGKPNGDILEMGLNLPDLLGEEPFSGLIKRSAIGMTYLEKLKDRVRQEPEPFNILLDLVRKECEPGIRIIEEHFSKGLKESNEFKAKRNQKDNYDDDIPELFFEHLNINAFIAYNSPKNCFVDTSSEDPNWIFVESLVSNSQDLFEHMLDKSIAQAYECFAKEIYTYYAFGLWKDLNARDYKTLKKAFYEHLKGEGIIL